MPTEAEHRLRYEADKQDRAARREWDAVVARGEWEQSMARRRPPVPDPPCPPLPYLPADLLFQAIDPSGGGRPHWTPPPRVARAEEPRPTAVYGIQAILETAFYAFPSPRIPVPRHYSRADRKGWRSYAFREAGFRLRDTDPLATTQTTKREHKASTVVSGAGRHR